MSMKQHKGIWCIPKVQVVFTELMDNGIAIADLSEIKIKNQTQNVVARQAGDYTLGYSQ